jgi:subtilisin
MKRSLLLFGLAAALLAPAANAAKFGIKGVNQRLAIVLEKGVTQAQGEALAKKQGLEVLDYYAPINTLIVRSKPGRVGPASVRLNASPFVKGVARDFWTKWIETAPASFQATPLPSVESVAKSLPKLGKNVGKNTEVQWGVRAVNAPAAWASNRGRGVKVAVVDTGIDPNHPELAARVKGGVNALDENTPWHDDHSHGTHVAGIIAATMNGTGVVGVAPEADLYAVKVLTKDGSGSLFGIVKGIMWCAQNGMQVVNMSLGAAQGNFLFEMAVNQLKSADIPLIAAAGNDGKAVNFPAAYEAAVAISAMCPPEGDENAKLCNGSALAAFSSRGPEIEFIMPGVKIPSTVINGEIKAYSGTSMAAPHAAGLAALAVANGASGQAGVRAALKSAAVKVPNLSPSEQGNGMIDAGRLR